MKEKKLEEIKETVETAIEETKEKKREEKSVVVDKPKRVRKTKKKLKKEEVYLQINGMQYDVKKYVDKIKEKHPDISELSIYIKPEDNMVYYVADYIHDKIEIKDSPLIK